MKHRETNPTTIIHLPSQEYPFTLSDLPEFNYHGYTLCNVYENLSHQQREMLVAFWLANDALPDRKAALERSHQACYLMTNTETSELVGLTTIYPSQVSQTSREYLIMRMFIGHKFRPSPLSIIGVSLTKVFASTKLAKCGYAGLVNINENKKLARPSVRKLFEKGGYKLLGQSQGQDVWLFDFANHQFVGD